jgi:inosose dehydratase
MRLGYHAITWGGLTATAAGVTSVKDLRYRVPGDMPRALREIAAAGYAGVELFEGNVLELGDELRGLLDETGLELVGVYTGAGFVFDEIRGEELHRIAASADAAARAGASQLVVGGGSPRTGGPRPGDLDHLVGGVDAVTDLAADRGLTACFHPHLGTIVEAPNAVDAVLSRSRIGFCPDTAHLAAGGGDPADLVRRYGDRVRHVHLKDLDRVSGTFRPLGTGDLDLDDVLAAVHEIGYDDWLVVELDTHDGDPADAARTSRAWLAARGYGTA